MALLDLEYFMEAVQSFDARGAEMAQSSCTVLLPGGESLLVVPEIATTVVGQHRRTNSSSAPRLKNATMHTMPLPLHTLLKN